MVKPSVHRPSYFLTKYQNYFFFSFELHMRAYEIESKERINYYIKHVSCITNNIILHVRVELGIEP